MRWHSGTARDLIAIGNGTASRETDKLAAELMQRHPELDLVRAMVSEAGASIYSASELASREFPDIDVALRGAVSIARRLQDPLAELVKIEPRSIGVGQYQHDVNQVKLARMLDAVVEDCVNAVGVDVNTASVPLLARVSGLNASLAGNIVAYRDRHGAFASRRQLQHVPRLGDKTFEQAAGFLRVMHGGDEAHPLDASAVHPEAYPLVERILRAIGQRLDQAIGNGPLLRTLDPARFTDDRLRPADGAGHPARARKARPRSAARVQHRRVPRGRATRSRTCSRACSSKASSPTSPTSAPSSTSACTRTAWSHVSALSHRFVQGSAHRGQGGRRGQGQGARGGRRRAGASP